MQTKLLEIRDRMTFIAVLAIATKAENPEQLFLLRRCGYPADGRAIMLTNLNGERPATADPFWWNDRTMKTAHNYIYDNFETLKDGDVVDVEFILKETNQPKISERFGDQFEGA